MKLLTNIKPRTDGTVAVRDAGGKPYVFKRDEFGALACDIPDAALVASLLSRSGEFEPANAEDFEMAEALLRAKSKADGDEGGEDDDGDFTEAPNGGLPVESNTPPEDKPAAKARRARS
jgi:hypothetical protein